MLLRGLRAICLTNSLSHQRTCHKALTSSVLDKADTTKFDELLADISKAQEPEKSLIEPGGASDLDEFAPYLAPTFNLAAYANKSPSLKKFIELGVDLSKIEKRKGLGQFFLGLDFERNCKEHLTFLHDLGVPAEEFGAFITTNPLFFKESLDDLKVRINYLESKRFQPEAITRIVMRNPFWLMYTTKRIDARLGYFQKTFELSGKQVRFLSARSPRLITYHLQHVDHANFSVREEMGFDKYETRDLLLDKPKIFKMNHEELLRRFEYAHHTMQVSHADILKSPELLLTRQFKLKQRHEFLVKLGRNQYDPKKELYISLTSLCTAPERNFVEELAKSCMEDYYKYLKSL